jgi:UDP-N-acetylglucosamine 1-carboxyvinyltransferase
LKVLSELGGTDHRLLPDMIEIGSFIGLAAMTGSEITIKDVQYDELGMIPDVFKRLGIKLERRGDDIYIPAQDHYEIETFIDGSITDRCRRTMAGLYTRPAEHCAGCSHSQAKGSVLIHQKMFESRLFFVDKLLDMGAQIILCDPHRATVIGLDKHGTAARYLHDLARYPCRGIIADRRIIGAGPINHL